MKKFIALIISLIILVSSVVITVAQENSIGDANGSGTVDVMDATTVQRHIARIISLDEESKASMDVDGDKKITIMDCTTIQLYVAKIITTFPCEKENPTEPTEETTPVSTDSSFKPVETQPQSEPPQPTVEETQPPTVSKEQICYDMEQEILRLVNIEREKENLNPVSFATDYYECAKLRAFECRSEETFSHTRPNGEAWYTVFNELNAPTYRSAGENIALYIQSAEEVVDAWMNSPGHRANILTPEFTMLAVAVYETPKWEGYYAAVQLFIQPI